MMVRLAFAIMVQADADIMLIDEVLAVGDAAFAQKCMDVFHERRGAGKTVVLVTHDMATVQALCHRAMLLHDGEVRVHRRRPRTPRCATTGSTSPSDGAEHGRVRGRCRCRDGRQRSGGRGHAARRGWQRVENVEQGEPITVDIVFEAARELAGPIFVFHVLSDGAAWSSAAFTRRRSSQRGRAPGSACACAARSRTAWCRAATPSTAGSARTSTRAMMALQALRLLRLRRLRDRRRGTASSRCETDVEPVHRGPSDRPSEQSRSELREVPGPSALGGGWRRSLELLYLIAVTDFKQHVLRDGARLRVVAGPAADAVRRPARGVHPGLPARLARSPHYPVFLLLEHRAVRLLPGGDGDGRRLDRRPRGGRPQDPVPAAGDPARGRADQRCSTSASNLVVAFVFILAFGVSPTWTWLLLPRGPARRCSSFTTAVSMIVSALYPRFRDVAIIWTVALDGAVLRDAGAVSDLGGVADAAGRRRAQPAGADLRAGPAVGHRPERPPVAVEPAARRPGSIRDRGDDLRRRSACLAVWVFSREAPRIAEAL